MGAIHQTPYAGSWYPGLPGALKALLNNCFQDSAQRVPELPSGRAVAFIVPHAGIRYSGTVASSVYRCLSANPPRCVAVLYFSHNAPVSGVGCPQVEVYATPLGMTRVDTAALARLAASPPFRSLPEASLCDHSLEIQLPYLESACPGSLLIPLCVGMLSGAERRAAAASLAPLIADGTVVVASTDFTHYGRAFGYLPFPVDDRTRDQLSVLDRRLMDAISTLDPEALLAAHREWRSTMCGIAPVTLLLETLRLLDSPARVEVLDYQTSGDITGDFKHCVSYAALAFTRPDAAQES
jgi:hypothetical protein